uniref:Uncharacterized protein n=1 Tax=Panagrolaimus superbus TaxID=310955 RepID=A0A914Y7X4_9BILA
MTIQSKRDQEKIKERFSNKEPLPGRKRARSVFNDTLDNANDTIAETTISNTTSSARSRRTRTLINPNYREDNNLNESRNTLKRKDESRLSESFDHLSNISFSTPSSTGYQEVPSSAWNYGYDSLGRFQKRIIVMDLNDKKYAHEYGIYKGCGTRCLGCYRVKNSYRNAKFDNQKKLFVPTNHLCTPKLYAEIKEEQKKIC